MRLISKIIGLADTPTSFYILVAVFIVTGLHPTYSQRIIKLGTDTSFNSIKVEYSGYRIYVPSSHFLSNFPKTVEYSHLDSLKKLKELQKFNSIKAQSNEYQEFNLDSVLLSFFENYLNKYLRGKNEFVFLDLKSDTFLTELYCYCKPRRSHGQITCKYYLDKRRKCLFLSYSFFRRGTPLYDF